MILGTVSGCQPPAAPAAGIIQNVHAMIGQTVAAGMILFEVAKLDPVWVKVPVYVGDLAETPGAALTPAHPATAPPRATRSRPPSTSSTRSPTPTERSTPASGSA